MWRVRWVFSQQRGLWWGGLSSRGQFRTSHWISGCDQTPWLTGLRWLPMVSMETFFFFFYLLSPSLTRVNITYIQIKSNLMMGLTYSVFKLRAWAINLQCTCKTHVLCISAPCHWVEKNRKRANSHYWRQGPASLSLDILIELLAVGY